MDDYCMAMLSASLTHNFALKELTLLVRLDKNSASILGAGLCHCQSLQKLQFVKSKLENQPIAPVPHFMCSQRWSEAIQFDQCIVADNNTITHVTALEAQPMLKAL